jgi:hypothetical protein
MVVGLEGVGGIGPGEVSGRHDRCGQNGTCLSTNHVVAKWFRDAGGGTSS